MDSANRSASVTPQFKERSTVIPQSEERSTVTSESDVRTLKTIYVIPSNGKVNSVLIPIHRLSSSTGRWQCLQVWTWTKSCNRTRSWSNRTRPLPHFYCPSKYQLNPVFGCSENKKCSIFPVNADEKLEKLLCMLHSTKLYIYTHWHAKAEICFSYNDIINIID